MGFLEVAGADLGAGDLGGQRQHRRHAAMRVVQAVDQVQVAGPAAARAGPQPPGQLCLRPSRERAGLLMPHMDPVDAVVAADGVHHRVEAVPTTPYMRRTPAASRISTSWSATVRFAMTTSTVEHDHDRLDNTASPGSLASGATFVPPDAAA
jgi:hypothetical protein